MLRLPDTIDTFTGVAFNYDHPEVNVADVAHGLAHICRFAGHVNRFISVAEHSVIVSRLAARVDPTLALPALWHDAHEAYIGDMPKPLKAKIGPAYAEVAHRIDCEVANLLGVDTWLLSSPIVKEADDQAALFEAFRLKPHGGWLFAAFLNHDEVESVVNWELGLTPTEAKRFFMYVNKHLMAREQSSRQHTAA